MHPDTLRQVTEEVIPFNRFLGLRALHIERGSVRLQIPWRDELVGDPVRPAMHGGVISMLADTCGGITVWSALDQDEARVSTIDLRVDYVRPGRLFALVAQGEVVRVGGRVGVADIRLFHPDEESVTVATGKGVYSIHLPKDR